MAISGNHLADTDNWPATALHRISVSCASKRAAAILLASLRGQRLA